MCPGGPNNKVIKNLASFACYDPLRTPTAAQGAAHADGVLDEDLEAYVPEVCWSGVSGWRLWSGICYPPFLPLPLSHSVLVFD